MRAIDADAITYESIDSCDTGRHEHYYGTGIIAVCKEDIDAKPTIQPEPHIGYWKPVGMAEAVGGESAMWGSAIAYHVCSECWEQALEEYGEEKLSDFCPHCGAKMEVTT